MMNIVHNKEIMHFEITLEGGEKAYLEYRLHHGDIAFMHTVVPEAFKGRGIATSLAEYAFNYAKEHKLPVMVYCPFVGSFLKKHPEYKAQLDPKYR